MRILDINDNELQIENLDLELGRLINDKIFIKHHDAIPSSPGKSHYWPSKYFFTDGSHYIVNSEDDPHVIYIDEEKEKFGWNVLKGEPKREIHGISLQLVIDSPAVEGREAWDEYEDIQRYILYTEDELALIKAKKEKEEKQKNFINNGPDILENNSAQINDINSVMEDVILLLAEIAGGSGE